MSEEKRNITILINGKEITNTVAAINREYKKSIKELNGMTRGSEEYKAKMAEIKQLKGILDKHKQDLSGIEKQIDENTKSGSKFSQIMGGGLKSLNGSFLATVASATAVFGAISSGIRTIRDFNVQMDKVQAISGANAEQMAILEATAKQMGATTVFSASESAEAMTFMAMAGWDTQQIVEGLPGVLDLAAASGESLALTSDIVTDALTAFGMQASESGRLADLLAKTSSSANTNVAMMGDTFRYVAPVFGAFGFSAEDAALATGLMANAGIKATQAGTTLRGALARLAKPTSEVTETMDALGLNITDADGNFLPFIDTMDQLREKFSQLTPEQQASSAASLFGTEAMSGMLAIVNASEHDYAKLTDATRNYDGAAKEMANTMNDNLDGAMKRFGSVVESIVLEFSSADGVLKRFVNSVSDTLAGMSSGMRVFLVVAGGLTAVITPILLMLPTLAQSLNLVRLAVLSLNTSILANPFVAAGIALTTLGIAASKYITFTDAATASSNKFNKAVGEAEVQTAKQSAEVDRLAKAVLDETKSEEKRLKALDELKKISPDHFRNLTLEKAMMGELATAVDSYRESLLNAAKIRVFTKQLDDAIERQERLKQEIGDGPGFWDKFFGAAAGPAGSMTLMYKRVGNEMAQNSLLIEKFTNELEKLSDTGEDTRSELEQLQGQLDGSMSYLATLERGSDAYKEQLEHVKALREEIKLLKGEQNTVTPNSGGTGGGTATDPAAVGAMGQRLEGEMARIEAIGIKEIDTAQLVEDRKTEIMKEGLEARQVEQQKANQEDLESAKLLAEQKAEFQQEMNQLALNTASQLLGNQIANQARRQQQALDEQREQGLLSEEEYQAEREEVQRKAFQKQKLADTATAIINGALAVTKATAQTGVLSPFVIPGIVASTAAQVALIQSQKYEKGGSFLVGPSHKQGGMPVIDPRTGQKRAELEGGEYIIRKRAVTPSTLPILRSINEGSVPQVNFGRYRKWKYEDGGLFGMDGQPVTPNNNQGNESNEAVVQAINGLRDDLNRFNRELRVTLSTTELREFEQRRSEVEKIASVRA